MKRCFYVLFVIIFSGMNLKAAPGDTTWVQANITQLTGYGNYDSSVTFPAPGTTYRKIFMIFTLGKYMCAGYNPAYPGTGTGGTGWCGDWDYTVQNYLMTPGGDTLELGRFITPYANALGPRTPWTATQRYIYDVTDYASLLQNNATMRIFFSGYSGGFTANIRFAFIEGIPERTVLGVNKLWGGSFGYGGTPDINSHFTALSETAPAATQTADLKFTVTGHGSDANGCCEFMAHNYQVMLNGTSVATKNIWRDNCGFNELYPQSGTWLYQRGNWCPGALVYSNFHDLPGITAGSAFNVALQFDPYTGSGGSYTTEAAMIYYGGMNKTLDASLDEIISPTSDQNYFRENPIGGSPTVLIKNSGSTTITSVTFQYGLQDSAMQTFTWYGTLTSLQDTDIALSPLFQLNEVTGIAGTYNFIAKIVAVNGVADADSTNNTMTSQFVAAPRWPSSIKILFETNNEAISSGSTICETSWIIYDRSGNIFAQRTNASISTLYTDTVNFIPGLYQLVVYDSSCDGLQWWVNAASGNGITAGFLNVRNLSNSLLPMNGYNYSGTYNNDFGCGYSQYFYAGSLVDYTGITNISEITAAIEAYPNPAQSFVNIDISGLQQVNGTLQMIDALGRVVVASKCTNAHQQINIGNLVSGVYTILFVNEGSGNRLSTRLLIVK